MDVVDDDLLRRSGSDAAAFETLVVRLSREVHGYLARRAPREADDLLAQVWTQAFAARRSFDPAKGPARAWLFGVARHVLLAHWRRAQPAPVDTGPAEVGFDPWPAVDDRLTAASVASELRAALKALTPGERELILLVAWERLTPSEAAAVLSIPPATARTRLHRARVRLRAHIGSTGQGLGVAGASSDETRGGQP